ncbi:773_t:CDS:2, partial [Funneliformis mosseae]
LMQYARRYRLRLLGGVAAPLDNPKDFKGRMYSFISLPDTTNLPVHLNGTWAQGSDRAMLLIEKNDIPDLDHLKLNWNRHILLNFLPKLHCKLLLEAFKLKINDTISKFWPFPSTSNPKYAVEYGFKVLKHMFQNENILINDGSIENNVNNRVEIFFKHLSIQRIEELRTLLLPKYFLGMVTSDDELKSLVRLFPIWEHYSNSDSGKLLKPASCGFLLHSGIRWYKTRTSISFICYSPYDTISTFVGLNVPYRDTNSYTFEDVEFPRECNESYVYFLFSVLVDNRVVQGLRDRRCFPNSYTKCLKNITDLFDPNNHVFRTVFGGNGNTDVFLHSGLLERAGILSSIGFNNTVNQSAFNKCADKIEELQNELEPPTDLIYRGFTLVDHLYKNINVFNLESIRRVPIFPIAKSLGKPHDLYYHHNQNFGCLKDVILPQYRDVAWSQMPLIAENVIPPPHVIQKHPSFGKPNVSTVVKHLRFLYHVLRINDEWKNSWAEIFKHNVFEVYKWLEEESLKEDIGLTIYIRSNDPLFLNFNMDQDPFNRDNWVTANDLVLNRELGEEKYVDPRLAKYPTMLKNAGVKEIKPPNFEIRISQHDQSNINRLRSFEFLLDQSSPLNDITFSVNGENIKTSRYMLASSSKFFHRKFTADPTSPITITVGDIQPNSMRILLRYLYSQDIDDAIQNKNSINIRNNRVVHDINRSSNLSLYKDLLKLADDYELDHLKEQMEFRISRLIKMSNATTMKTFAETLRAKQLKQYCDHYIRDNSGL